jgi:hypothetical protein
MALNIAADVGSEIVINPSRVDAEIAGNLGATGETTFEAGTTVDPTSDSLSYYFTYDVSKASGNWSDYQTSVDGGTITFTAQPYEQTEFEVSTNKSESVVVTGDSFTDNGDGTWSFDASGQLENNIAEVTGVTFRATVSETQYETVQLRDPFEVISITNDAGKEQQETTVTQSEPHNDTNYITQEEWEARQQRIDDLIEEYEEDKNGGGGGGGGGWPDLSNTEIPGGALIVAAAGAGYAFLK